MIITQIFGGLGNQMFQYAAGRALSIHHNVELKLDILDDKEYRENKSVYRDFLLNQFSIQAKPASQEEIVLFKKKEHTFPKVLLKVYKKLQKLNAYRHKVYREPFSHFDKNFLRTGNNVYLEGYWQSEKYFYNIKNNLQKEFQIKLPPKGQNLEILKKIKKTNSVSIHIRRGDYITDTNVAKKIGSCGLNYYQKAIEYIKKNLRNPFFFIFSDDTDWVKKNFLNKKEMFLVENNHREHAIEDLRLMYYCKHNIIANSSFSWWGAWLNQNPLKIIIAPEPWFELLGRSQDIVPETWIQMRKNKPKL